MAHVAARASARRGRRRRRPPLGRRQEIRRPRCAFTAAVAACCGGRAAADLCRARDGVGAGASGRKMPRAIRQAARTDRREAFCGPDGPDRGDERQCRCRRSPASDRRLPRGRACDADHDDRRLLRILRRRLAHRARPPLDSRSHELGGPRADRRVARPLGGGSRARAVAAKEGRRGDPAVAAADQDGLRAVRDDPRSADEAGPQLAG